MRAPVYLSAGLAILLGACDGSDGPASGSRAVNGVPDEQLPIPAGAPGRSITGMPGAPGPGQVGPLVARQPGDPALDENGNPLPTENAPIDGLAPDPDAGMATLPDVAPDLAGEPNEQDAVAVVRDYYAAINARNYAQAFALWSDGGRATGQSPQQFADGFARTNGVSVELMSPGRIDAATTARYVEVPVALSATQDDGSQRRYVGMFTLRRAVGEGATPDQRAWRIASADLRVVEQ